MTLPRMRGRYPVLVAAVEDMMEGVALDRRFAASVARKAGLRQGPAESPPRTVIDAYMDPGEPVHGRQYATDLSGATRIRITSRSSVPVYLFRSEDLGEGLRPGDYALMLDTDGNPVSADDSETGLNWQTLAEGDRIPLRLNLSTEDSSVGWNADALAGPFSVSVQVAS